MFTLDLSGFSDDKPGIVRFGGLFRSVEDAVGHGKSALDRGRFAFKPEFLWVRDEKGEVIRRDQLNTKL